jgi:hypothetical protein
VKSRDSQSKRWLDGARSIAVFESEELDFASMTAELVRSSDLQWMDCQKTSGAGRRSSRGIH